MVWIIVLLMCCLPTVESWDCKETEIIVGQSGEELELKFQLSYLRDEYNKYITEYNNRNITRRDGKRIVRNEIQVQDLRKESYIKFKNKMDSNIEDIIYTNGNPTGLVSNLTEIFLTDDAFVVKKTKLQKEDAGIYYIEYETRHLGRKVLVIAGKPTIKGLSPPNPVLKPEDNYISTIQLECHSVSTSIGDCQLSMYTVWYKNGMRMTNVDPTVSQIIVILTHIGGNFTCLATDYLPCYQRLQTTILNDVLNIEECNKVFESETFIVQPEFAPIDVKLEPDQRVITVAKNEDLQVRCIAKCHPQCAVTWGKHFQGLKSSGLIYFTNDENMYENDLVIENVISSHEGYYGCLVNNTHGEVIKGFTLSVRGKPTIIGRSPLNLVLKPEDNYISTIQLECHRASLIIGEYQLSVNTVWYKNGMRMTDVDPTLSQINVTVDHNGGSFTCLTTDYLPCYQRLQTTKYYDVLNIEECNKVFESETFILQPEFAPIDVKLEPDQKEITVIKNEDLRVRCTAKCHPKCAVKWEKHFQGLKSSGFVDFTKNMFDNDLVIENVTSSHEGYYGCLVNNIHGEVIKGFTLSVKEKKNGVAEESSPEEEAEDKTHIYVIFALSIALGATATVIVVVIMTIKYKKYPEQKNGVAEESSPEEDVPVYEEIDGPILDLNLDESLPGTSTDNNSTSRESVTYLETIIVEMNPESATYDVLEFNISNGNRHHGTNPDPENGYTRLSKKRRRNLNPRHWFLLQRIVRQCFTKKE